MKTLRFHTLCKITTTVSSNPTRLKTSICVTRVGVFFFIACQYVCSRYCTCKNTMLANIIQCFLVCCLVNLH